VNRTEGAGSGRRGRWAAFPTEEQMPAQPAPVPDIGPLVLRLHLDGADRTFDMSVWPCPRLTRQLAATLRTVAADGPESSYQAFKMNLFSVRKFVRFITGAEPQNATEVEFSDLEAEHIDAFEQALIAEYGPDSDQPRISIGVVVRLLRVAFDASPTTFDPDLAIRLRFLGRETRARQTRPLDAYPQNVFEAIRNAALADVRAIARRIQDGEARAATGQDPNVGGWDVIENVLWHIARHGPVTMQFLRPLVGKRLGNGRPLNAALILTREDNVVFLILLICMTGLEPECAKRLQADCLTNPARGFVSVNYVKRRAHGRRISKSMRVSDGGALHHPGGLIRLALRLTARAREFSGSTDLWVDYGDKGLRDSFPLGGQGPWGHVDNWQKRHGIDQMTDADGTPVRLDLRRLRKTYKSQQYLKATGVLADFTQGHTADVAANHYANIPAHDELHDQAVENGLREALDVALPPPVVLDKDGTRLDAGEGDLPPEQVQALLSRESDVFLASCRDFYDSPFGAKGKPCPVSLWGCLECPNAVFTTRHLPQVLTFLDFIERQREEYPVSEWNVRYGLAWDRIVRGIRAKFRDEQITTAQTIAESGGARLLLPPEFWEAVA